MKRILLSLYAIVISAAVLAVLYFVNPLVIGYPKIALVVLILLLTSIGAGLRSLIEVGIMSPMIKLSNGKGKLFLPCAVIFIIGMLIAIAIPWLNGIANFNVWNWLSSIGFTMFNFETFYAFVGSSLRMYNSGDEI